MKKLFLLSCFVCAIFCNIYGQNPFRQSEPQMLSPNAAEFGKYGKIPVNYFNGLPNITIPLTELHAKGYTLPVYLTYHASGNKPDQHPGWVGLGWSLHAGGSITRIIKGNKDELSRDENGYHTGTYLTYDPGYLYRAHRIQTNSNWTILDTLYYNCFSAGYFYADNEPDEFIVNLDGLQASFYITGDGEIKIVSRSDTSFDVNWTLGTDTENTALTVYRHPADTSKNYRARRFNYLKSFTLRDLEGNVYYFGGADDAIEYSVSQRPYIYYSGGSYHGGSSWQATATANTWMLTKVERADGEVITFSYKHEDSVPIVVHDFHYGDSYAATIGTTTVNGVYDTYSESPSSKNNLSVSFLLPSYLESISCRLSNDHLDFSCSPSTELGYTLSQSDFELRVGYFAGSIFSMTYNDFMSKSFFLKLDTISGPGKNLSFTYTNNGSERLKLLSINFLQGYNGPTDHKYAFTYNSTPLPDYNARQTDRWGYYNGIDYSSSIGNYAHNMYAMRIPDANYMQAEILTEITYPTGGKTVFEYEPHSYYRIVNETSFCVETCQSDMIAGGLRIKSITDFSGTATIDKRIFTYDGTYSGAVHSSGILSGRQDFYIHGTTKVYTGLVYLPSYDLTYASYNELPFNQLSDTNGNHVTYSYVTETHPDGGKTIYHYSNHETSYAKDAKPSSSLAPCGSSLATLLPFNSGELFRGLLLDKELKNAAGTTVLSEAYEYSASQSEYVKSISKRLLVNQLGLASFCKIYCTFPFLSKKTVVSALDSGSAITETYNYQYNDDRRKTTETHTVKGISDGTVTFYPADRTGPFYTEMQQSGMSGIPVGQVKTQNGQVVSGQELVFKPISVTTESGTKTTYLPDKLFTTELSAPVALATYSANPAAYLTPTPDIEFRTYDSNGNLTGSGTPDGILTTYRWSADALHPTLVAKGVNPGRITYKDTFRQVSFPIYYTQGNTYSRTFATLEPTTVTITLYAAFGFDWLGYVSVDNQRATLVSIAIAETPPQEWMNYASTYPSSVSFSIPAGTHTLRMESGAFRISPSATSNPSGSFYCIFEEAAESTTPGETLALYDFEDGTGNVAGFRSGYAHSCPYTVDLTIPSDRNYVIDYMLYTNGSWQYNRETYAGGNKTIGSAGKRVDNIRIFPADCEIITASYDDAGLMTTRTDARGVTESYEYDALQRLVRVRDNTGNITEEYSYNYANGTGNAIHNSVTAKTYTAAGSTASFRTTVNYADSLGRPTQNVLVNGAASGWDLVTLQDYDACGREFRKWLPAPVQVTSGRAAGAWSMLTQIQTGGNQVYPSGDAYRYGQPIYEASPRDRVKEYYGPGAAWRSGTKHRMVTTLLSNTTASSSAATYYRGFTLSWTGNMTLTLSRATVPSAASIHIVRTDDEDGQATLEFTNSFGQTILVRQVYGTSTFYDTHYIYDNLGRLTAVLPPELTATLEAGGTSSWNYADISGMAYLYCYDSRGNCIARSLPGAGWTYTVYDMGNRPVLAQDAAQRAQSANAWTFALPDHLGRPALRGTTTLSVNAFGDPYKTTVVQASLPKSPTYTGTYKGYVLSGITLSAPVLLETDYYDNYAFAGASPFPAANHADFAYDSSIGTAFSAYYSPSAQGLPTGSLLKVLDNSSGNQYLWSVSYYDDKARVVQHRASTHLGGVEKDWFLYDFVGNATKHKVEHKPGSGTSLTETTTQTYDTWDRPLLTQHQIGSATAVTVSNKTYDKAGRLATESRSGNAALKSTYAYNIRSWVTGITGMLFTETLTYNTGSYPRWSGDVNKISWKDNRAAQLKTYALSYDTVGRLTTATFNDAAGSSINFAENVTAYDRNGNIKTLQRYGRTSASAYGLIDYLAYTYSGNKVTSIKDTGSAAYSSDFRFSNGTNNSYSFSYDAAGRMTADASKGISSITWNVLGLPQTVTFTDSATVSYTYAADGTKLRESRTVSGTTTTTDYTGNLVLENGTRSRLLFDGGYVSVSNSAYHFFITDHLGSVRVVANTSGTAEQYNHYYPLGGPITQYSTSASLQPLKFQGKEWSTANGLNQYDFGARRYDPATGRWLSQDPLAEKYYAHSPYLFCAANPVRFVDPEGTSTRVKQLDDGTYEVIGVDVDDDYNIYLSKLNDSGEWTNTGISIGMTPSIYSFVKDDNTSPMIGAIIDPADNSGIDFMHDHINNLRPLGYYMFNASNNRRFDFKVTNGSNKVISKELTYKYRGMPIYKSSDGIQFYGSARDVGNLVAGYYAAAYGMTWEEARTAFDSYNGSQEPYVSYYGQRFGYNLGNSLPEAERRLRHNLNFLIPASLPAYQSIMNIHK